MAPLSSTGAPVASGAAASEGWAAELRFEDWLQPDSPTAAARTTKTDRNAGILDHIVAVAVNAIVLRTVPMVETLMNRLYASRGRVPYYYVKNAGFRRLLEAAAS